VDRRHRRGRRAGYQDRVLLILGLLLAAVVLLAPGHAAGAAKCADEIDEGVIVIILADGGWKYLSTGAWTDDLDVVEQRAKGTIYF